MFQYFEFSKLKKKNQTNELLEELYSITKDLEKDYPNHYNWFHSKFIKDLDGIHREIIYCMEQNKIVGVAFLKNMDLEKKICTIYVMKDYRKMGIGSQLMEKSFQFLETTSPLISMPDYKENCFLKIIEKYQWKKTQVIESCYSNHSEFVFNGTL